MCPDPEWIELVDSDTHEDDTLDNAPPLLRFDGEIDIVDTPLHKRDIMLAGKCALVKSCGQSLLAASVTCECVNSEVGISCLGGEPFTPHDALVALTYAPSNAPTSRPGGESRGGRGREAADEAPWRGLAIASGGIVITLLVFAALARLAHRKRARVELYQPLADDQFAVDIADERGLEITTRDLEAPHPVVAPSMDEADERADDEVIKGVDESSEDDDSEEEDELKVKAEIGRGRVAIVSCGTWNGNLVAIKAPRRHCARDIALLQHEVQILGRLSHPNVVKLVFVYEAEVTLETPRRDDEIELMDSGIDNDDDDDDTDETSGDISTTSVERTTSTNSSASADEHRTGNTARLPIASKVSAPQLMQILVLEMCPHGSLSMVLRQGGRRLNWCHPLLHVARGVAAALEYLHSADVRIAHGDVRPSNGTQSVCVHLSARRPRNTLTRRIPSPPLCAQCCSP